MKKKIIIISIVILAISIIGIVIFLSIGQENKYTISFDTNGGKKLSAIKVNDGDTVNLPKPEKEGYIFVGWYTEDGKAFDFNTVLTSNIKLIAKWKPIENTKYQVTFDANGGTHTTMDGGNTILVQFTEINGTVLKPVNPQRNGYNFVGWYTEDGKMFDFNTVLTSNIKLIAKWKKK